MLIYNNKENLYEKIILQDAEHDDNITQMELISQDDKKILLFWFIYHFM